MGVVAELRRRLAPLPLASQKKVLGENVMRFYGLVLNHASSRRSRPVLRGERPVSRV